MDLSTLITVLTFALLLSIAITVVGIAIEIFKDVRSKNHKNN